MNTFFSGRLRCQQLSRRDFLWLMSISGASVACTSLTGCATDPVTGKSTLVGLSEGQEIAMDRQQSPHQFSSDYGPVQDEALNRYLDNIGRNISGLSHRPTMPYSFRVVNAVNMNAYAFPGGSIATTRGLVSELEDEAELAALLGHEIGHVNARHAAEQAGRGMLANTALSGASALLQQSSYAGATGLLQSLGGLGAGALLAHYSRDSERESDELGMEYMTRAGYNPHGMVDLMGVLQNKSKHTPGVMELMFSTHPMNDERAHTAKHRASADYASFSQSPIYRERFMDNTARLRQQKATIKDLQKGEQLMAKQKYGEAENAYRQALVAGPTDYAALVMMAKCQLTQKKVNQARPYLDQAKDVYPQEAQAHHLSGITHMMEKHYDLAWQDFNDFENLLPGNPNTIFMKGIALEGMQDYRGATVEYTRYLRTVNRGEQAQYAYGRLTKWGVIKQQ